MPYNSLDLDIPTNGYLLDVKKNETVASISFNLYFINNNGNFFVTEDFHPSFLLKTTNNHLFSEALIRQYSQIYKIEYVYKIDPSLDNSIYKKEIDSKNKSENFNEYKFATSFERNNYFDSENMNLFENDTDVYLKVYFNNLIDFRAVLSDIQKNLKREVVCSEFNIHKVETLKENSKKATDLSDQKTKSITTNQKGNFSDMNKDLDAELGNDSPKYLKEMQKKEISQDNYRISDSASELHIQSPKEEIEISDDEKICFLKDRSKEKACEIDIVYGIQHNKDEILTEKDLFTAFLKHEKSSDFFTMLISIHEYDIPYDVIYMCERNLRCGLNYIVTRKENQINIEQLSIIVPPSLNILAFDIEVTKEPLKFPTPESDQIVMISLMSHDKNILLTNSSLLSNELTPFEYCLEKFSTIYSFNVLNSINEKELLIRFLDVLKNNIDIITTYNGEYFDIPFIIKRLEKWGISSEVLTNILHLDCFLWVKRDSYLPMGCQGLKAATFAKLGYQPEEIDPEEMMWYCQNEPQRMGVYAVSDAVATYLLYNKYVHPFIFSLCTLIPMGVTSVLSRGSGTLCEALLISAALKKGVIVPQQKGVDVFYFKGRLCEEVNYVGGHVESLQSGIFRSDFEYKFTVKKDTTEYIKEKLSDILHFVNITNEKDLYELKREVTQSIIDFCSKNQKTGSKESTHDPKNINYKIDLKKWEDTNMQIFDIESISTYRNTTDYIRNTKSDQKKDISSSINLDGPEFSLISKPLIYHMDVSAMYPNIILTNKLQPISVIQNDRCIKCDFYEERAKCQKKMDWKMRLQYYLPTKNEIFMIRKKLITETISFEELKKLGIQSTNKSNTRNYFRDSLKNPNQLCLKSFLPKNLENSLLEKYKANKRNKLEISLQSAISDYQKSSRAITTHKESSKGVFFSKLHPADQKKILKSRIQIFSRTHYKKIHNTDVIYMQNVVCQRAIPFYVEVVRNFRDKRYIYKDKHKNISKLYKKTKDMISDLMCIQNKENRNNNSDINDDHFDVRELKGIYDKKNPLEKEILQKFTYLSQSLISKLRDEDEITESYTEIKKILKMNPKTCLSKLISDLKNECCDLEKKEVVYESLQVAHKCILNSFYGYVMRKGARWYSMEMAAIVCEVGSKIIKRAKDLIESFGIALELDTDGIWCMIPENFPNEFVTKNGTRFNLILSLLNYVIEEEFANNQYIERTHKDINVLTNDLKHTERTDVYQSELLNDSNHLKTSQTTNISRTTMHSENSNYLLYDKDFITKTENSIKFELDGPYKAMIIPSSLEEGKLLKKKYLVINRLGNISELKGFETKRRGELKLIKKFQEELFGLYNQGNNLKECYQELKKCCDYWLTLVRGEGKFLEESDIINLLSESKNMSKKFKDYLGRKTTATCVAQRLSEFLGDNILLESGLKCQYIIGKYPKEKPITERAIPVDVFYSEKRKKLLKKWLKNDEIEIKKIIDWKYYEERLESVIVKLVLIPGIIQGMGNNFPEIKIPRWATIGKNERLDIYKMEKISERENYQSIKKYRNASIEVNQDKRDITKEIANASLKTSQNILGENSNIDDKKFKKPLNPLQNIDLTIQNTSNYHLNEIFSYDDLAKKNKSNQIYPVKKIKSLFAKNESKTGHYQQYINQIRKNWLHHFEFLKNEYVLDYNSEKCFVMRKGRLIEKTGGTKIRLFIDIQKTNKNFNIRNQIKLGRKDEQFITDIKKDNTGLDRQSNILQKIKNEIEINYDQNEKKNESEIYLNDKSEANIDFSHNIVQTGDLEKDLTKVDVLKRSNVNNMNSFEKVDIFPENQNTVQEKHISVQEFEKNILDSFVLKNIFSEYIEYNIIKSNTYQQTVYLCEVILNQTYFYYNYSDILEKLHDYGIEIHKTLWDSYYSFCQIRNEFSLKNLFIFTISVGTYNNEKYFFIHKHNENTTMIISTDKNPPKRLSIVQNSLQRFLKTNIVRSSIFFCLNNGYYKRETVEILQKYNHFVISLPPKSKSPTIPFRSEFFEDHYKKLEELHMFSQRLLLFADIGGFPIAKTLNISEYNLLDSLFENHYWTNQIMPCKIPLKCEYEYNVFFEKGLQETICIEIIMKNTFILSIIECKTIFIEDQPSFYYIKEFIVFQNFCKFLMKNATEKNEHAKTYQQMIKILKDWMLFTEKIHTSFKIQLKNIHIRYLAYIYFKIKNLGAKIIYYNQQIICIDTKKYNSIMALEFFDWVKSSLERITGLEMLKLSINKIYKKLIFIDFQNYFYENEVTVSCVSVHKIKKRFLQSIFSNQLKRDFLYDLILKKKCKDKGLIKILLETMSLRMNVEDLKKTCYNILDYDFFIEETVPYFYLEVTCDVCKNTTYTMINEGNTSRCIFCLSKMNQSALYKTLKIFLKSRYDFDFSRSQGLKSQIELERTINNSLYFKNINISSLMKVFDDEKHKNGIKILFNDLFKK